MIASNLSFRVADLFCGAGGSSEGARRALAGLGYSMDLVAVNHWNVAIESHTRNHPEASHLCVDVYKTKPRDAVPSGELDLLMASPTCTFFSRARGGRPVSWDQRYGRMTPTQVYRWLKELDVRCLLVENVPEFVEWGPIDKKTGKPIREKRGVNFRAWIRRLERLGYKVEWRVLNAADFGDATTRQRFFLLGRKDGEPITWPNPTHSKDGSGGLPRWRPAREIIDWEIEGASIYDRERPLSPKTLVRIHAGAVRFGWPQDLVAELRDYVIEVFASTIRSERAKRTKKSRAKVVSLLEARVEFLEKHEVSAGGRQVPLVLRTGMHKSNSLCVRDTAEPVPTITTDGGLAIVVPQTSNMPARSTGLPLHTITTTSRGIGLARPVSMSGALRSRGGDHSAQQGELFPDDLGRSFVLNRHGENGSSQSRGRSVDEPLPTATCRGAGYLVEPTPAFVLSQASGGAPRSTDDPVPTIPTDGAHALITTYYGNGACSRVERPLPTVTTKDRFGLVMPVTHDDASMRARSLEDPVPAITSAPRGELAFIAAAFGERKGQTPRVHSVEAPAPTICAKGRINLVRAEKGTRRYDVLFRMLVPNELASAMGFSTREAAYEFAGTKTEITRQIGNAVPVATASALVRALMGGVA